jgi:hypothetical protein
MTELSDMETAKRHAGTCLKFAALLTARVERMTRVVSSCTQEFYKDPARILDGELYQMRCAYLRFDILKGHKNAAVPCDARCTGARGHNCECQCGGKNHGQQNAIEHGMVAA